VNSFRVNEVKKRFADTKLSINEIALNFGFGSIAQFNRVFRAETVITAGQYRRKAVSSLPEDI
jgi:AraC family transcriptional regulator